LAPMLKNGYVTFGSFNRPAKITARTLAEWSRILSSVPNSRLLMKGRGLDEPQTRQHWQSQLASHGMDPQRVAFSEFTTSHADHLAAHHNVDIMLDTFPYAGTMTTCEALWMGVPVITLAGQTHVSRVGMSLLTGGGLSALVAATPDEYANLAVALANDSARLSALRQSL